MLVRLTLCLYAAAAIPLLADPPRPVVDAVPETFTPVPFDQQHLAGLLAGRLRANTEGYLEHIDEKAVLRPHPAGDGSHMSGAAGLFLQAAANSYDYTGDAQLKSVMDRVARKLGAAQEADGYLRIYTGSKAWGDLDLPGLANDLLGLLAYSSVTGDEESFAAARRLADFLVTSAAGKKDRRPTAVSSLVRPLLDLYRHTGDQRYLELCESAAEQKVPPPDDLEGALVYGDGLAEMYRLKGIEPYLKLAVAKWSEVRKSRLSITGAPLLPRTGAVSETGGNCQTMAWMQLTFDLFRITGQPRYADELERTVYNQLLAAQNPATGKIYEGAPLEGAKQPASNCNACNSAEPVGISQIPQTIWGRYGSGIAILTYSPGRARVRLHKRATVQIYAEGDYPESGNILLHVEPSHDVRFPVHLRVPPWTKHFSADAGETHVTGRPGEFLVVDREWKRGDTIKVSLDMPVVKHTSSNWPGQAALQRGPQILTLGKKLNARLGDLSGAAWSTGLPESLTAVGADNKMPFDMAIEQAYAVIGKYEGKAQPLILTPFADAVTYRTWLKAPPSVPSALTQ